jgi:hypothetical protein
MHFMQPTELFSATKLREAPTSRDPNVRGHQRIPLRWCVNRLGNGFQGVTCLNDLKDSQKGSVINSTLAEPRGAQKSRVLLVGD